MSVTDPRSDRTQPVGWLTAEAVELAVLISPHRKINLLLCTQTFMAHCTSKRTANQLDKCDIFEGLFCCGPFAFSASNLSSVSIEHCHDDHRDDNDDDDDDDVAFA